MVRGEGYERIWGEGYERIWGEGYERIWGEAKLNYKDKRRNVTVMD